MSQLYWDMPFDVIYILTLDCSLQLQLRYTKMCLLHQLLMFKAIEWYVLRKRHKMRDKRTNSIYQWPSQALVMSAVQGPKL